MNLPNLPKEFPFESRAAVKLAEVEASREVERSLVWQPMNAIVTGGFGAPTSPSTSVFQYAMSIFAVFAREACKVSRGGTWGVDQLDVVVREYLRLLLVHARDKYTSANSVVSPMVQVSTLQIVPHGWRAVERTSEWRTYQDELAALARVQSEGPDRARLRIPVSPVPLNVGFVVPKPKRLPRTVTNMAAARRLEAHLQRSGISATAFASSIQVTDRTLRTFRRTGKIDKGTLARIATEMNITREELLKPDS